MNDRIVQFNIRTTLSSPSSNLSNHLYIILMPICVFAPSQNDDSLAIVAFELNSHSCIINNLICSLVSSALKQDSKYDHEKTEIQEKVGG
ncbi:hypothetical protein KIN20_030192 [Parelaphostrongylus tenuis]|uniref:Uncharacterized protein n=1 Tax=Parelaphostrongylus tenuis TaxID=148309 RepID=A0AAD5R3D0_PARTN|nr:hypothetical protein KIN20_030192 [Parelaphostrongylus tenuis]